MEEDARYLKKKIKTGAIDVHPTLSAIVVHFEVEATILGEAGDAMLGENKQSQKTIMIKNLSVGTDLRKLSEVVVEKCNLIHPSKVPELEQLLYYLQTRKVTVNTESVEQEMERIRQATSRFDDIDEIQEKADLNELESYVDLLYDDMKTKTKGTSLILQLARNPDNLAELIENEMVLGALSRVLREDWKKSIDLCTNIVYIFFCFSSFSEFHSILLQYKIGSSCLQIIENELKRFEYWNDELAKKKKTAIDEKSEESQKAFLKSEKKFEVVIHKQEQLLRVSVYLLLNIAEDTPIEIKMTQKSIIVFLNTMLERKSLELLILVVSFLKRLSIYKENKDVMKEMNVVSKLNKMIPHQSDILVSLILRLILNLSFDKDIRTQIIKCGMLPKLVNFVKEETHRVFALCILYHVSVDDKCKGLFSYTDIVPIIIHILQENEEGQLDMELMALCVNITQNPKIAAHFAQNLRLLLRQSLKNRDSLMLKMVRNILSHEVQEKKVVLSSINEIVSIVKDCPHEEQITVELLGVLAELNLPEIDFRQLVTEYNLVPWISRNLAPANKVADDVVLEIVRFVGNVVRDEDCAQLFANAGLPNTLIELITAKQEDDEIVLQILYVFYQMIFHKCTRELLIKQSQAPAYLIDLMHDKNTEVRRMCDTTLDIISEYDEDWATKIQYEKFKWHNSQWLEMVTQGNDPEVDSYDDDYLPREMMLSGDSTADLLYQHEQDGYRDQPYADYPYDGDHRDYGGYPGEDGYHPGDHIHHPGLHTRVEAGEYAAQYQDQEEDYDYYQQHYNQGGNRMISPDEEAVYGAQHSKQGAPPIAQEPRNAGYMTNLDSFSRTLENWHLRS
ncbi:kinesin-associated protein 3-like [Bolinopsis microptera]|uniref:kinesin-associated protein 3-like n=1 Tax=Bolinopsis microptera TaxID=2820187 RepID=UPI003079C581